MDCAAPPLPQQRLHPKSQPQQQQTSHASKRAPAARPPVAAAELDTRLKKFIFIFNPFTQPHQP
jgi:hypothetical protein